MLNKKCFVLDLDGTVYLGDIPIQETVDFILRHWDTIDFHFLSNNTSKAERQQADPDGYPGDA